MLTLEQMIVRFLVALALGALIGLEREVAGREAGIKTAMMVASGAAMFSMIGLNLPYIVAPSPQNLADTIARNSGYLAVVANVVVGVGFLGAGIIIKTGERVRGLTTAADIWATAAIGILVGIGSVAFAVFAALAIAGLFFLIRKSNLERRIRPKDQNEAENEV